MSDDLPEIKKSFRTLERNVLLLVAVPLPLFALSYLYTSSGSYSFEGFRLPVFLNYLMLGLAVFLLVIQYTDFQRQIRSLREITLPLQVKLHTYGSITIRRFWKLFWVGLICALGLLLFENPGFTIAYAVTLVYISLGKPTPDRIVSALRLKQKERDTIFEINRRD